MLIIGAIVTVIGIIMTAVGGSWRNSWEYQLAKAWGASGEPEMILIDAVFAIGIIALIVGVIMVVFGFIRKSAGGGSGRGFSSPKTIVNVNVPPYTAPKQYVCTKCGTDVSADMMFCPNCGSADKAEKTASAPVQQAQAFCPGCGASVAPGEAFCHQCGTKI